MMEGKKIGVCRLDITPPLGVGMSGYNIPHRNATHILDPLYINTIAFEENGQKAAIVVCDLLGIYDDMPFELTKEIAEEQEMDPQSLFICNTHTHTGPHLNTANESDPVYDQMIRKKIKDSVALALQDLKSITEILAAEKEAPDINITRRFLDSDGTFLMRAELKSHPGARYGSVTDRSLQTTVFKREDGSEIILVNFAMHPDSINGTGISADFPGAMRKVVEFNRPGSFCVFLNGAEGNMVGKDALKGGPLCKKAVTHAKGDPEMAYGLGRALGAEVLRSMEYLEPVEDTSLSFKVKKVMVPTVRDRSKLEWAKRVWDLHYAGRDDEYLKPGDNLNSVFAQARIQVTLDRADCDEMELPVNVITFGGTAFVGLPGEPFCELGIAIREASPFTTTNLCCQCNRTYSYLAPDFAYDEGGYEIANSRFKKGVGEILVKAAQEILQELFQSTHIK